MRFDWDDSKAEANRRKHGVGFDEAAEALMDPARVVTFDVQHSADEDRWEVIGLSGKLRLLTVIHTEWDDDGEEVVRIITARRANKDEVKRYDQQR